MSQASHPISRWLRSRQLLTDSGYGVATSQTYPFFAIERLNNEIFSLSAIMPPCTDEQLTISLDQANLVITAVSREDSSHIICEHRFKLSFPCTIAGANWERTTLLIELICTSAQISKTPNELVAHYQGSGSWLQERQKSGGDIDRAA